MSSSSPADPAAAATFADLSLSAPVLAALSDVGYEAPSPIQAATIPHILAGNDVVGQAQTGTGKTAAFALPLLSKIDIAAREPQAMILVPTRELAIQVAEAFQRYATHLPGFHVLPVYGGQSYTPQLQSLRRGVHVVVGTPGRVMDHLKRGTLKLDTLRYFVLDEADEMLQMGFLDDVEWILQQAPQTRQIALFSATMPAQVRRIAQNHLRQPAEVTIRSKTTTAASIRQRYWMVSGMHKLDALTRILEAETFDAMIVFARTKQATTELAERLEARGFAVEALNGDIPQNLREKTIGRLKAGQIDIVVATDVAARGLDVERVSHVINFDVPYDPESYVHRIGRTGRAGRAGDAILFIAPRERNMLRVIERTTRQPISQMELPTVADVNEQRVLRFNQRITDALAAGDAEAFRPLIERYEQAHNVPAIEIAAALASVAQGKQPLLLDDASGQAGRKPAKRSDAGERKAPARAEASDERVKTPETAEMRETPQRSSERQPERRERHESPPPPVRRESREEAPRRPREDSESTLTYRIEVGRVHGVKPANIVGAIANEAGIEGQYIGRVQIEEDHSYVDLPGGMPKEIFRNLQKVRVAGQQLQISLALKSQVQRMRGERPFSDRSRSDRPQAHRSQGDRPRSGRPGSDRPRSDRPRADRAGSARPRDDGGRSAGGPRGRSGPGGPRGSHSGKGGPGRSASRPDRRK